MEEISECCQKCLHFDVCDRKKKYRLIENTMKNVSISIPTKEGKVMVSYISDIDWVAVYPPVCKFYMDIDDFHEFKRNREVL